MLLCLWLLASATGPAGPADTAVAPLSAARPPPSSWDLQQRDPSHPSPPDEPTMVSQLGRTFVSLAIVIVLIYAFGKLVLPRLTGMRWGARTGTRVRVTDRVALGPRHHLYVVEVDAGRRLLLGGSDRGIDVLTELSAEPSTGDRFRDAMQDAADRGSTDAT